MKKSFLMILLIAFAMLAGGCAINAPKEINAYYLGVGENWLVSHTVNEVNDSYYTGITIQYIFDAQGEASADIGPIEYELSDTLTKYSSTYAQALSGVASFHTSTRSNKKFFDMKLENQMTMVVKWQEQEETIVLKREK